MSLPDTDTVYVDGLPSDVCEKEIADHFGSIGLLKVDKKTRKPKIWLYRDKVSGQLKGDGTVTYEDPYSAPSAVEWFDGKDFKGELEEKGKFYLSGILKDRVYLV